MSNHCYQFGNYCATIVLATATMVVITIPTLHWQSVHKVLIRANKSDMMALILLLMFVKFQWVSSVLSINGVSAGVLSLHLPIHANNFHFFVRFVWEGETRRLIRSFVASAVFLCPKQKDFRRELRCVRGKWRVGLDESIDPVRLCCPSMRGISPESGITLTARQELFRPRVHESRRVVMNLYEYLHTGESWTDGILV